MATSMNIPVQTLRSLRGVFFVEMSSCGDGRDKGGRGSTAGAGEGLRGDKTERDDTENVQNNLSGRAAALHLRVEGLFIGGKKRGSVIG